jgi:hypothetical protein
VRKNAENESYRGGVIMADTMNWRCPLRRICRIARLAASGVANRLGFDFETIEDIKGVCGGGVQQIGHVGSTADYYKILFKISKEKLDYFIRQRG